MGTINPASRSRSSFQQASCGPERARSFPETRAAHSCASATPTPASAACTTGSSSSWRSWSPKPTTSAMWPTGEATAGAKRSAPASLTLMPIVCCGRSGVTKTNRSADSPFKHLQWPRTRRTQPRTRSISPGLDDSLRAHERIPGNNAGKRLGACNCCLRESVRASRVPRPGRREQGGETSAPWTEATRGEGGGFLRAAARPLARTNPRAAAAHDRRLGPQRSPIRLRPAIARTAKGRTDAP